MTIHKMEKKKKKDKKQLKSPVLHKQEKATTRTSKKKIFNLKNI